MSTEDDESTTRQPIGEAYCGTCGGRLLDNNGHTVRQCVRELARKVDNLERSKKDRKVWHGF